MKAWLITWEGISLKLCDENRIVAILSLRKSDDTIAKVMELLYQRANSTASRMAHVANLPRLVDKAKRREEINGVPHDDRITCGDNPWLYGRKVTNLKVVVLEDRGIENVTWKEPPTFQWQDQSKTRIKIKSKGKVKSLARPINRMLSSDQEMFLQH